MSRRLAATLVVLLALLNIASGLRKIVAFGHTFRGERALARAQMDRALEHLEKAAWWNPADEGNHLLVSRAVQLALANGLPLRKFEGRQSLEVFGFGLGSLAHAIALNPADAYAWFNLAPLHQSVRSASERLGRLRRAAEAALRGEPPPPFERRQGLDVIDQVTLAAVRQALELEPEYFHYREFMADLYWDRGMVEDSAREIRASLALSPLLASHNMMEDLEFVRAMAQPILEGLEEARRNPYVDEADFLRARAGVLEKLERFEEAAAAYTQLRSLGGNDLQQECDVALARMLQKQGRWRESLDPLARASRVNEQSVWGSWAIFHTGEAQSRLGDHDAARASFEKYLILSPGSVAGYEALVRELTALDRPAEAVTTAVAAVRRFPRLPHLYENVIALLRAQGRVAEAIPYAEALRKVGDDPAKADRLIEELDKEVHAQHP